MNLVAIQTDVPREARIDAAGALHHIIVRGIERRKIFWDDAEIVKGKELKLMG